MNRPITLKDIASETGLSVAAVSKALNGYPNVSESTRRRVLEASERLGYQRPMRSNGTDTRRRSSRSARRIGLVLPKSRLESRSVDRWVCAMTQVARHYDVRLELVEPPSSDPVEREAEISRQAPRVSGLVFYGYVNAPLAQLIAQLDMPLVAFGDVEPMQPRPRYQVSVDAEGMGLFATRALLAAGHRRIGFIGGGGGEDGWADQWRKGYQLAMLRSEAGLDPELVGTFKVVNRFQLGVLGADYMASLADPPSAYVLTDMSPATSFRQSMVGRGIDIGPENLVCGGQPALAEEQGLTGFPLISVDLEAAACHTLHLLCRLMKGQSVAPVHIRVPFDAHHCEHLLRLANRQTN